MNGKAQTVTGLVDVSELGNVLMHEHILCDFTPPSRRDPNEPATEITLGNRWDAEYRWRELPGLRRLDSKPDAIEEMERMAVDGCRTVVELSIPGIGTDHTGLRDVAQQTGVNIIRGCGRYTHPFTPHDDLETGIDELAARFIEELEVAAGSDGVRAGIIGEMGNSWPWEESEKRALKAAFVTQQHCGAAVTIHPGMHPDSVFAIAEFAARNGAIPNRTVIDHIDRRIYDPEDMFRLAGMGVVLEFDLFGVEASVADQPERWRTVSDHWRVDRILELIARGHGEQIVVSHDIVSPTRFAKYGGHGYCHINRNVVPLMKRRGVSDQDLEDILVTTPAKLLAFL